jgi:hypothetical protein
LDGIKTNKPFIRWICSGLFKKPDKHRAKKRMAKRGETRRWYFAFSTRQDVLAPWWVKLLTRKGYTHVLAFAQADNVVVVLDPLQARLDVRVYSNPSGGDIVWPVDYVVYDYSMAGHTVVMIDQWVPKLKINNSLFAPYVSCVAFAKQLIGLQNWVISTPQQFFDWLLKQPHTVLFDMALLSDIEGGFIMGSFGGGNKGAGQASALAKKQLKQQAQVNAAEIARLNAETTNLSNERAKAEAEANRIKDENQRKKDLITRRNAGRSSLIATSELGVSDSLG